MVKVSPSTSQTADEYADAGAIEMHSNGALFVLKKPTDPRKTLGEPAVAIYGPTEWRKAEVVSE